MLVTVFWSLKGALVAPVLPYCVLVASQLAQPFLINTILDYVGSPYDDSQDQKNIGYGLIGAYGLVYLSIAVSTDTYQSIFCLLTISDCHCVGPASVVSICGHATGCSGHFHIQENHVNKLVCRQRCLSSHSYEY